MLQKGNKGKHLTLSYNNWVSVVVSFCFLFLVAFSSFSSMNISGDSMELGETASVQQEVSASHDHNMMDHDMTDAACLSFQCHAMATFSIAAISDRDSFKQVHETISYSLSGSVPKQHKRPPRHV